MDDTRVVCWYHRRFIEVTNSHYINSLVNKEEIFSNVIDFFNETWKHKPKPFRYNKYVASKKKLKDQNAEEIRETSIQPTAFIDKNHTIRYNKRKIKELPSFVNQLNTNLALPLACQYIYLNYHFLSGLFLCCSTIEIMNCLGPLSQRYSYNLIGDAQEARYELMLFSVIILQTMVSINRCPESAGLEIVARSLILYGTSKYFTQFIDQYDAESSLSCALIVPYQLTQVPGSDSIFQLEKHNKPIKCVAIGGFGIGVVFSLSDKLSLMDFNTTKTFETDYCLEPTENELIYMLVYLTEELPIDKLIKDYKGGFLVGSKNEIISYSFEMSIYFKKKFLSQEIINMCLISANYLLVAFAESIQIFNIYSGELITQKCFSEKIKFMKSNFVPENITHVNLFSLEPVLIVVVFETAEVNLFAVDAKTSDDKLEMKTNNQVSLELAYKMPSSGFSCNSLYYEKTEAKGFYEFILTFNYGMMIILLVEDNLISFKKNESKNWKEFVKVMHVFVRLKLKDRVELIVKSGNPRNILLLGSDGCLYLLDRDGKFTSKIKGESEYSNALIPATNKLLAFTQTTVEFFYYEKSTDNNKLLRIALVRKMNIHYDDVIYCKIINEFLYTASKDSTFKISIFETRNVNVKYIDFDRNEIEIHKLVLLDSIHVLALMKNSKYRPKKENDILINLIKEINFV